MIIIRQLLYAEGVDGAVFMAGMVSLGFTYSDPKIIVREAVKLIHPKSPYRKCIDLVIKLADKGKSPKEIFNAIEDIWHIEYPATNNAVSNGGIVAASLWFGKGDFLKTVNLAYGAADYTDADCNAANAGAVIGAMKGLAGIPTSLIKSFRDRIKGESLGEVILTPAVDESISGLATRTTIVGEEILNHYGVKKINGTLFIPIQEPITQPAELFTLADLMKYWNPEWTLDRAGFGGAGGGMSGIRGNTYLNGDTLATYPRDEIRSLLLHRTLKIKGERELSFEVGVDAKRAWELNIFINNEKKLVKIIEGGEKEQQWQPVRVDLSSYDDQTITIRLYQRVLISGKEAGNAYWKSIKIK